MAEFQKVMADAKRMCKDHQEGCRTCPLWSIFCSFDIEDINDMAAVEQMVTDWANSHPEVYPTWNEWVRSLGVSNPNSRITPELAKRFGVEAVTVDALTTPLLCQHYKDGQCLGTKEMETCKGIGCGMFRLELG